MELIRFFGVSVVGVLIDLSIAYSLATFAGVPLWAAATLGFLVAALVNYATHEIWTFRQGNKTLSITRSLKYLMVSVITLLARIAVVFPLEQALSNSPLLVLFCATGVSFFVNFALSKFFVFSSAPTETNSTS